MAHVLHKAIKAIIINGPKGINAPKDLNAIKVFTSI